MHDAFKILVFVVASTLMLAAVIVFSAGLGRGKPPRWLAALGIAFAVSAIGILFAKYGENFGLPWWIYYTAPMLATILIPPLAFRLALWRAGAYVLLAFATAPLIHAAFFYGLGWREYMPFLRLPTLS
ncbi:MAG: hypothetical protein WAU68_01150 [Vitreimonas sp.]